jgi:hypothetical protein
MQANDEKLRLEEKQRQERNAAEAAGKSFGEPIWFDKVSAAAAHAEIVISKNPTLSK